MKNLAYISVLSLCIFFLYACDRNVPDAPGEPEPLLNRADSVRFTGSDKFTYVNWLKYDSKGRYLGPEGLIDGIFYTYNNDDQVSSIKSIKSFSSIYQLVITTTIHYQNGLPVSGSLKNYAVQYKDVSPTYWTDSIQYTLTNNKVTQIRYFDRRYFADKTNQLIKLEPGTTGTYTVTYERNNLKKLEQGSTVLWDATFGTRNGYFAANRFKFLLFYGENPEFHSENDLASATQPSSVSAWQKLTYTYQYNLAGYPKSSELTTVQSTGLNPYKQTAKYHYK